jgi:tRNA(Ile)-lysidine synthase
LVDAELLELARAAADWRADVDAHVRSHVTIARREQGTALDVAARCFTEVSIDGLSVLWPAIAARIGATLDRRAIDRLSRFTRQSRVGARVQLAGGWEVVRSRNAFRLRRTSSEKHLDATLATIGLSDDTHWREWIFRPIASLLAPDSSKSNDWVTWLPTDEVLAVRAWEPGDAILHGSLRRKVKRLLSGAGITGHERSGWPVVMSGTQVVWVPGVRRSDAASDRSGRPGLSFSCEHIDR